jgi:hypothetical protein
MMFGGRYFAIRDRLAAVVAGIADLAREQDADATDLADDGGASWHPTRPLRLVAIGEPNAGKSSLFNTLFGVDVCEVGELPTRGPVMWFGATREPGDGFQARDLPPRLAGVCEWLDPPGLNLISAEQRAAVAKACERADAVLAVFHWTNPWEPSTWDFIAKLRPDVLDRTLVVLQQTDRGDPADRPVLLDHLGELSQRRVGRLMPVFPVSARAGAAAWGGGGVPAAWRASGFDALERRLDALVVRSEHRFNGLLNWWHAAARVVRRIEERVDRRVRAVEDEALFLGRIETMVEEDRDRWIGGLDDRIDGIERAARRIRGWIGRRLGLLPSFVRCMVGDDTAAKLDGVVIEFCTAAWRLQAAADVEEMKAVCRGRWERLVPEVREMLDLEMGTFADAEGMLASAGERFVERFVDAAAAEAGEIRPGAMLANGLRRRQRALVVLFGATLCAVTVAGGLGALGYHGPAWSAVAVAAGLMAAVVSFAWASRRAILRAVDDHLAEALRNLGARVRPARLDGVRVFFGEYLRTLDGLRRRVAASRHGLQPLRQRCSELFLGLQAIGQQLDSRAG